MTQRDRIAVWWVEDGKPVKVHVADTWKRARNWALAAAAYDETLITVVHSRNYDMPGFVVG